MAGHCGCLSLQRAASSPSAFFVIARCPQWSQQSSPSDVSVQSESREQTSAEVVVVEGALLQAKRKTASSARFMRT
jgi:hypothetical protein